MISKNEFVKSIEILKAYEDFEQKLYDLGIDLINNQVLSDLIFSYSRLLALAANDTGKWTDWWIWETQYGTDKELNEYWLDGEDVEQPGHCINTAEELYDVIAEERV